MRKIILFILILVATHLESARTEQKPLLGSRVENKQSKILLITGCARSGTGYISALMKKCGVDVGHEKWGEHGCSSWMLAVDDTYCPWGVSGHNTVFRHVFHQVRNPRAVITSVYSTEPQRSWDFICKHIPEIHPDDDHLVKCAKYWYYWNIAADQKAEYTYKVEEIENAFNDMGEILGMYLDKSFIPKVSKKTNTRKHKKEFSWTDLKGRLPEGLFQKILNLAKSYGYSLEELSEASSENLLHE